MSHGPVTGTPSDCPLPSHRFVNVDSNSCYKLLTDAAGGPGLGSREGTHHRTRVGSHCDTEESGPVPSELEATCEQETGSGLTQDKVPGATAVPTLGNDV